MILCPFCPIKDDTEAAKRSWQTCECRDDAADGAAVRPDDLHRLVFGELHQQQIAPSSADPESCSALHQQGLHSGPGRRSLHGPTRIMSAETQQRSRHLYAIATLLFNRKGMFQNRLWVVIKFRQPNHETEMKNPEPCVAVNQRVCVCTWWCEHSWCSPPSSRSSYPKPLRAETQLCSGKRIYRRPSEKCTLRYPTTAPAWGTHTGNWNWTSCHPHTPEAGGDSLQRGARPGVHGLAQVVVSREGQDLGPTAGPHTPAVLPVQRLAQTHDRRVDLPHHDGFHRLPVLLLRGEECDLKPIFPDYKSLWSIS